MYKLWLDDSRPAPPGWMWAKNYDVFTSYILSMGVPKEMSMDHDLNPSANAKNGTDCVKFYIKYLEDTDKRISKKITIHSMNEVGALNMIYLLNDYREKTNYKNFKIYRLPFGDNISKRITKPIYDEKRK